MTHNMKEARAEAMLETLEAWGATATLEALIDACKERVHLDLTPNNDQKVFVESAAKWERLADNLQAIKVEV